MSRFNQNTVSSTKTVNLAGGQAYSVNPKFELVSILLSSFVQDKFYRKAGDEIKKVVELLPRVGYEFGAKAALYARKEFGMRSITHVVGGEVAKNVKGATWSKKFLKKVFHRPDDMMEILSYVSGGGKIVHPVPNCLKKAIKANLEGLSEYHIAKYKCEGKTISMIDLVNLTHPKSTPAITKLMKGLLKPSETWETKLTQAGQVAETEEQKLELKSAAWEELLTQDKLGYLAMLRNLRNITSQAPHMLSLVNARLVDKERISKNLIFPFQFHTAIEEIGSSVPRDTLVALSTAMELSLSNVPKFDGKTLIVVDNSGSMGGKPINIACLFAGALYKTNDSDLMVFSNVARYVNPIPTDSLSSIHASITRSMSPSGTNFNSIFDSIKRTVKYDRIIILSDMQGWMGYNAPTKPFSDYCKFIGNRPYVYSFDLNGYGSLQFPEAQTFCIAGWSEKIFDVMKLLEKEPTSLVKEIEKVQL